MTAPRPREQRRPPSPPDRRPARRGGGSSPSPSIYAASAAGRPAGPALPRLATRGLVRSARALAAAALLALSGALAVPAQAQTCTLNTGDLWCGVVTVALHSVGGFDVAYGFVDASATTNTSDTGALSDETFSVGSNNYTIDTVTTGLVANAGALTFSLTSALTAAEKEKLVLHVGSHTFAFSDSGDPGTVYDYEWSMSGLDWSSETSVTLRLRVTNTAPVFADATTTRDVPENSAPSTDVGDPIPEASDADSDTLTYFMDGTDEAHFSFNDFRQILTFEDLDYETKNTYSVTVTADDGNGGTDTIAVTINVTDVNEKSATPAKPTLAAVDGSSTTLTASWEKPDLDGGPDITGYVLQYRAGTTGNWEDFTITGTAVTATITGLTADTEYQVQVRAKNGETDSDWSNPSNAVSTNAEGMSDPPVDMHDVPTITTVTVTSMPVVETDTYGAGERIEVSVTFSEAVRATSDTDFVLNAGGAKRAPLLLGSDSTTLVFGYTVTPADVDTNGIWIGNQDRTLVGNRNGNSQTGEITSVATGVAADLTHDALGTQSGHKVNGLFSVDNNRPVFSEGDSTTREVANDSLVGTRVGAPVTATDLDNDQLAYSLENHNPNLFIVGPTSAYIYTVSNGSYSCASYGVTVKADDGKGGTDTIAVTINITGLGAGFTESEDCTEVSTEAGDGPDLVVGSPAVSHDSPVAGATFTFSATVRNAGDTDSPATTTLRYYRSTDATISTADSEEGNGAVGALAASASSRESVELTAPSTPGAYYYGACVDAVSGEADTTNNCSTAVQVDVSEAEPVPALPLLGQLLLALGLAAGGAGLARRRGAPTA